MYNQANTIKSYEEIRRVVRGGPILTLTQKSILTFILLIGILGGLLLADCWGHIPSAGEQLQVLQVNGKMLLQRQLLKPLKNISNTVHAQKKTLTKTRKTAAVQLRHRRLNEQLRKRIRARKQLLREKRKCKVARIIFLVSLSKPLNKP